MNWREGGDNPMRTVINIAIFTVMAMAAMWAADVITRPPQRPAQSSLQPAPGAEVDAAKNKKVISDRPYHGL
jgi:hypothetical protein